MNKVLVLLTVLLSLSGLAQAASVQSNQSFSLSSATASTATSNAADTHVFVQALNPQHAGTVVEHNGDWRYLANDGSSISDIPAHVIQFNGHPALLGIPAEVGTLTVGTNINALIQAVCDDFQASANNKHIQLSFSSSNNDNIQLWLDEARIEQVLQNLLRNAITYTPQGGKIHVQLNVTDHQELECAVIDSGVGLLPEHLSLVFDRAFRVSEDRATEQNSNGLGLAICKSLVEAHNGSIGAYSEGIGKGAKFWFRLPITHNTH